MSQSQVQAFTYYRIIRLTAGLSPPAESRPEDDRAAAADAKAGSSGPSRSGPGSEPTIGQTDRPFAPRERRHLREQRDDIRPRTARSSGSLLRVVVPMDLNRYFGDVGRGGCVYRDEESDADGAVPFG
jgi:hypothetical protein